MYSMSTRMSMSMSMCMRMRMHSSEGQEPARLTCSNSVCTRAWLTFARVQAVTRIERPKGLYGAVLAREGTEGTGGAAGTARA